MKKRGISLVLLMSMMLTMLPPEVFAEWGEAGQEDSSGAVASALSAALLPEPEETAAAETVVTDPLPAVPELVEGAVPEDSSEDEDSETELVTVRSSRNFLLEGNTANAELPKTPTAVD